MFILFIIVSLIGVALVVAGIMNLRHVRHPLAYVAVVGGVVLGAAGICCCSRSSRVVE